MASKVICISASNVRNARQNSASTRACQLVREIILAQPGPQVDVEILRLVDYELTPCHMCGDCFNSGVCQHDPAFNAIYACLQQADALFVICPHYAPLPSKLVMLLEKLEEIAYLNFCANAEYRFPLAGKPVGLIAHGGQGVEAVPYYHQALLEPLAHIFSGLQMRVIAGGESQPLGAAFGIQSISSQTDSIFVKIEYDWEAVRRAITPLVENVYQSIQAGEQKTGASAF